MDASGAPAATCASTYLVVASLVELSPKVCVTPVVPVGKIGVPVNVGESLSAFASTEACKAMPVVAACTKAVVALWVVFVFAPAVGAVGTPVKAGEALSAFPSTVACKAVPIVA